MPAWAVAIFPLWILIWKAIIALCFQKKNYYKKDPWGVFKQKYYVFLTSLQRWIVHATAFEVSSPAHLTSCTTATINIFLLMLDFFELNFKFSDDLSLLERLTFETMTYKDLLLYVRYFIIYFCLVLLFTWLQFSLWK